jgi:uncharacterized membrane protein YhhN
VTVPLLIVAAALAVGDWAVVQARLFRLEYLLKPATLAVLLAATTEADLGALKPWVIAALACGLVGDIALMRSKTGRTDPPFMAGLAAFLVGHACFVVAFLRHGVRGADLLAGLLVAAGVAGLALPQALRGATRAGGGALAGAVSLYAAALAAMTVLAIGTSVVATAIGGALFLASDTLLARQRFVARLAYGDLLVMVNYHAAQFLVVIGLIRRF